MDNGMRPRSARMTTLTPIATPRGGCGLHLCRAGTVSCSTAITELTTLLRRTPWPPSQRTWHLHTSRVSPSLRPDNHLDQQPPSGGGRAYPADCGCCPDISACGGFRGQPGGPAKAAAEMTLSAATRTAMASRVNDSVLLHPWEHQNVPRHGECAVAFSRRRMARANRVL